MAGGEGSRSKRWVTTWGPDTEEFTLQFPHVQLEFAESPQSLGAKIIASGDLGVGETPLGTTVMPRPREGEELTQSHTATPACLPARLGLALEGWAGYLHTSPERVTWQNKRLDTKGEREAWDELGDWD